MKKTLYFPTLLMLLFGCTLTAENDRQLDESDRTPGSDPIIEEVVHYDFRLDVLDVFEIPDCYDY